MSRLNQIFVALDQMTDRQACHFIEQQTQLAHYKIGLELYLRYGRPLVEHLIKVYDCKIFLDLKLHDIPHTVDRALQSLAGLDIHFLTLHLSGGEAMVRQAVQTRNDYFPQLKLLGVAYLTSLQQPELPKIFGPGKYPVAALAEKADQWGLDGLVCSPLDLKLLSGIKAFKVCPGIRFPEDTADDQKRVVAPQQAFALGADYLVIGRSLTQADDLVKRIEQLACLPGET